MISATKRGVDELLKRQDDQRHREVHQTLLNWLSSIDCTKQRNDILARRQAGTGEWLLRSEEFRNWVERPKQILFCWGLPGVGKTIIAAIVIDSLETKFQTNNKVGIAYLFCDFKLHDQKPEGLLRSLLRQLIGERSVPDSVIELFNQYKLKRELPLLKDISKVLSSVISSYSRVFIVVDALDECQSRCRMPFVKEILSLQTETEVNIFATSRAIPEVVKAFQGRASLEIRASKEDVQNYIDENLSHLPFCVQRSKSLQDEIKAEIGKAADGMYVTSFLDQPNWLTFIRFLLAYLYMESLFEQRSMKTIRTTLQYLPNRSDAYDKAYSDALERIRAQNKNAKVLAEEVISWIALAERPLTTAELRYAIAIEIGTPELDERNLSEVEHMVSVCAGLITVDEESKIIRLFHYTIQEFLERTERDWLERMEAEIATKCVTLLSFSVFENGFSRTDQEFEERLRSYPLYDYAARYWGYHASRAPSWDDAALEFLQDSVKVEAASQAMIAHQETWLARRSQEVPRHMTGLHLAAYFGVERALNALLRSGHPSDPVDSYGRTPLSWASQQGCEAVVKLLLENNVNSNSKDAIGRTPLSYASQAGSKTTVELLLESGVDADSNDNFGRRPLSWAAEHGHEAVVKCLLNSGNVDANSRNLHDLTALSWAAMKGHQGVAKLLLEHGVNPNLKDKGGRMALSHAAQSGHETTVKLLLGNHMMDPDLKCACNRTPLAYALESGHKAVVELLLADNRVDPDAKDEDGWTPLAWAADEGWESIVALLLKTRGSNPNPRNVWNQTPLSRAARNGHIGVMKLLLAEKVTETDAQDTTGWTPLLQAAKEGQEAAVELLLTERGAESAKRANPNHSDESGRTPLSWAASFGHEAIVRRLLKEDAVDPDSRDKTGRTPLLRAAWKGHEVVVSVLLAAKADVKLKGLDGRTPLEVAAERGHVEVVKLLLDHGADINDREINGWTALHFSALKAHREIESLLRAKGASEEEDLCGLAALFS